MSENPRRITRVNRVIVTPLAEILQAHSAMVSVNARKLVPETLIVDFCLGCDNLRPNNECYVVDGNTVRDNGRYSDQARYADRGNCGRASVNGERGRMTRNGFIRF